MSSSTALHGAIQGGFAHVPPCPQLSVAARVPDVLVVDGSVGVVGVRASGPRPNVGAVDGASVQRQTSTGPDLRTHAAPAHLHLHVRPLLRSRRNTEIIPVAGFGCHRG
eukprot:CAMPEP_0183373024 /NCGR_PEP_ID=MMETSP0164_2-20130417/110178_1 /TAXON_ID=221442 /ORGANISM="Coccolithus pelagicus ssp braarudi, Strain PLY182g" /LENGTH=108 /DNA_ID=CAMNT_0025549831 /DNA_START=103 /DNA_END=426 /DNA_ORIENTATION=+